MKVVTFGSVLIDIITSIDAENIECITMHNSTNSFLLLEQGKKIEAGFINSFVGGGGYNTALCFARLGANVFPVLKIGTDKDGATVVEHLKEKGLNEDFVLPEESYPTGKSVIVTSHKSNPGIFVNRGANTTLNDKDLTPEMLEGADLVYISGLSGNSAELFSGLTRQAKEAGAFVACNPGILQLQQRTADLIQALAFVDVISVNKFEAASFAEELEILDAGNGQEDSPVSLVTGIGRLDLEGFASKLLGYGCKYVVVTDGEKGAYLCDENGIHHREAIACEVSSTIGAGDAFNATAAYSLYCGASLEQTMYRAAKNAASVASKLDAQEGQMPISELDNAFNSENKPAVQSFPENI
jgi:ribokinase